MDQSIAAWVGRIHVALHTSGRKFVCIDKKRYPVRFAGEGIPYITVGKFCYIQQARTAVTKWGELAREGKKVTQITQGSKYYGVIVEDVCTRYDPERIVGKL